jgi:FkbM family methyltransferase
MYRSDLIFDVGMHKGQDTAFYLAKGFRVVAIEANPSLARWARFRFRREIKRGQLRILNIGVGEKEGVFPFFVSARHSEWSSFDQQTGSRGGCKKVIQVPMLPLEDVMKEHGVPYYLKIDVEGYDVTVLKRVAEIADRPKFVSIENGWGFVVDFLTGLGYDGFKFINQTEVPRMRCPRPCKEGLEIDWAFPAGSSGPFGEETPGVWKSAEEIVVDIDAYWNHPEPDPSKRGWYDLHAQLA